MKNWKRTINNEEEFKKTWQQLIMLRDRINMRGILKPFEITIKEVKKAPTDSMRKYYWKIVVSMVKERLKELGNNFDEEMTHEFLKDQTNFYNMESIVVKNKELFKKKYKSISFKGEVKETLEYFELIKQWCAENLDLVIPDPEKKVKND